MKPSSTPGSGIRGWGRTAWAVLGILGVLVVVGYLSLVLSLVVVPLVLALFPATLLVPVVGYLCRRGVPRAVASLGTLFAAVLLFSAVAAVTVGLVVSEIPEVADSVRDGISRVEELVQRVAPDVSLSGVEDIVAMVEEGEGEGMASRVLAFTSGVFDVVAGGVLTLVILFFYLHSGRDLVKRVAGLLPADPGRRILEKSDVAWGTLGAFFRGQLIVALADGLLIGIGLVLLGIPLALPLAVLTFFGGLFPIVGALVTGAIAVLVALSDGGLTMGLIVAGLVVGVQQLESNVLAPLVLGRAMNLHPLVIILSVTAGGLILGVLGAFLAVPVVAVAYAVWIDEEASDSGEE
jgi:putative heme transporter